MGLTRGLQGRAEPGVAGRGLTRGCGVGPNPGMWGRASPGVGGVTFGQTRGGGVGPNPGLRGWAEPGVAGLRGVLRGGGAGAAERHKAGSAHREGRKRDCRNDANPNKTNILRTHPDRCTPNPAGQGGRTKPWLKVRSITRLGGRRDPAWPTENAGCPGIPPPAVSDGPPAYVARRSAPSPNQGQTQ